MLTSGNAQEKSHPSVLYMIWHALVFNHHEIMGTCREPQEEVLLLEPTSGMSTVSPGCWVTSYPVHVEVSLHAALNLSLSQFHSKYLEVTFDPASLAECFQRSLPELSWKVITGWMLNLDWSATLCHKDVPTAKANGQGLVPSTYNIQSLRMQQGSCGVFSSDKIHSAFMQLSTLSLQALPSLSAATSFRSIAAQVPAHTGLPSSMIEGNLNKMRISYSWEAISDATNWCRARKSKLIQTDTLSGCVVIQCHLIFKVTCLPWMVFGCAARPEGLRSAKC